MPEPQPYENKISCLDLRDLLDITGSKWGILVIAALMPNPIRYTKIKDSIPGISQRMLTMTLKQLERYGLVEKQDVDTIPKGTLYELSHLGKEYSKHIKSLMEWARQNASHLVTAREKHDLKQNQLTRSK